MSDTDRKIDEMFGMMHEMKPMLADVREGQKGIEMRVRATEIQGQVHSVKIERLETDLGRMSNKLRKHIDEDNSLPAPQPVVEREDPRVAKLSWWAALFEFLGVAPNVIHWIVSGIILAGAVIVSLWRSHG